MWVRTLVQGGQRADDVAGDLVAWLGEARKSLDLALYDLRLPGPVGDQVGDALRAARDRGVQVRIAFNDDTPEPEPRPFEPPPPRTEPTLLEQLGVPLAAIPGWRDLMHHKYVVRDGAAVWTGSTNWTLDSWEREENVLVAVDTPDSAGVRPWFCPGRGPELSHRIAKRIGAAQRRVRIATPVLTAGPILGTLCERIAEGRLDIAGVCDATQIRQVFQQWEGNPRSQWKAPLLRRALTVFTGKDSTPYAPGSVHDFMHAKMTVADDTVFVDAALAEQMAGWIDEVHARFPRVQA
jgi:phosphatidylserine/phosphatidylglycerophosphate/cardiolipin synthase-like enzyme